MNKPRLPLILALGGAVAMGASSVANADVMAQAIEYTTNFTMTNNSTGAQLDLSDFATLNFTSTGGYSGTLTGQTGYVDSSTATPVDLPVKCIGYCTNPVDGFNTLYGGDNSFTVLSAPPTGNYTASDQQEQGSPITGIGALTTPANVRAASYSGLLHGPAASHSTATNNLQANFTFSVNSAIDIRFDYNAFVYLMAYVNGSDVFPSFATAAATQDWTLIDTTTGTTVLTYDSFTDGGLNGGFQTASLNAPIGGGNPDTIIRTDSLLGLGFSTGLLTVGDTYQLSARNNVNTDAQTVPEPSELGLLGIGLLGMTMVLGRRRKKS